MENSFRFFPLWKRGMKGDLMAFQKAKLLQFFYEVRTHPQYPQKYLILYYFSNNRRIRHNWRKNLQNAQNTVLSQ
jgi:hypothetical protein